MTQAITRSRTLPHWLTVPLTAFLITRLVVFAGAYLADVALPMISDDQPHGLISVWNRWDTLWYVKIVEEGYSFIPGERNTVAFFPVYPITMEILKPLVGGSAVAAGLLISNVSFFLGLIVLYRFTESFFESRSTAARTVFYIASFPSAFFFSAVYTESLFLLFSLLCVYYARQHRWGWSAVFGALCAATRSFGLLIWVVVLQEWLAANGLAMMTLYKGSALSHLWEVLRKHFRTFATICLIPVGAFAYMLYLGLKFSDPFAFWTTQIGWGRTSIGPFAILVRDANYVASGNLPYFTYLNIIAFLAVLCVCIPIARRFGAGYAFYSVLSILLPVFSSTESMIRYILVVFPVFMMAGRWGRYVWMDRIWRIVCLPFLALFTALFVKGVFIG